MSSHFLICWRFSSGTPGIVQMISTGNFDDQSSTTSNFLGSALSRELVMMARTVGSSDAIARGVNTRLTSTRSLLWSGGSIMMISLGSGMSRFWKPYLIVDRSTPLDDENVSKFLYAAVTSACRLSA